MHRVIRWAVVVLAAAVSCWPLGGWAEECYEWSITAAQPQQNGKINACLPILKKIPELQQRLDRLTDLVQRGGENASDVQRFLRELNRTAQHLNGRQDELAAKLDEILKAHDKDSDDRVARQLAQLAIQLQDVEDKLNQREADPATAQSAHQALQGDMGKALATLDFATTNRLLDDLAQVKTSLARIERNTTSSCASDPALLKISRDDAERRMASLRALSADRRCPRGMATVQTYFDSAATAERAGDPDSACRRYADATQRASRVENELSTIDAMARAMVTQREQQAHVAEQLRHFYTSALTQANMHRRSAEPKARSPLLRRELAEADDMYAAAEAKAAAGRYDEALPLMRDAGNYYQNIFSQVLGVLDPTVPLVVDHSPVVKAPTMPLASMFPAVPDALCAQSGSP